ncbi:MAG: DinB family protein [Chitinophagaceae bacterium]
MRVEIDNLMEQLQDAYEGDPWFGRAVVKILSEINVQAAFQKPNGQHSIVELVWHMTTWREFIIDRLRHSPQMQLEYFEKNDWRQLDHNDITLWPQALERLQETQNELIELLKHIDDSILDNQVGDRSYNFRKLLYGILQHDIYHLGQIAYLNNWYELKKNISDIQNCAT